ncbi:MAG: thioesterase [Clostridia bacterium]|nr:thioesterase [Clostridia bacterium]
MDNYTYVSYYIKSTDCDINDDVLLNNLFGYLQEAAGASAASFGVSTKALNEHNWCWILINTTMEVDRLPKWGETIKIRTWSTGVNKFYWGREYEVLTESDEVICKATSSWIVGDMETHRPVVPAKYPELSLDFLMSTRRVFGEEVIGRIKAPKFDTLDFEPIITKYADYSDLDRNHHVNNTRYLAWFEDAIYKYGIQINDVKRVSVEYLAEVKSGNAVKIYVIKNDDGTITVAGYNDSNEASFVIKATLN